MSQTPHQEPSSNTPTDQAGSAPASTLIRIINPRALLLPDLQSFVLKALSTAALIEDAAAATFEMIDLIASPSYGLFVVREGTEYKGLAIVESCQSTFTTGCVVIHFYSKGTAETRKALMQAVRDFATVNGHHKIWGFDTNHKPRAFARLFKAMGTPKSVGEVFQFEG